MFKWFEEEIFSYRYEKEIFSSQRQRRDEKEIFLYKEEIRNLYHLCNKNRDRDRDED